MSDLIIASPPSVLYNCIAWAADDTTRWWWPGPEEISYWPPNVSRIETLEAFVEAFATLGYKPCDNDLLEPEFEKIAIFVDSKGEPTHAARQLPNGKWTSKLGRLEDVEHELHNQLLNQPNLW